MSERKITGRLSSPAVEEWVLETCCQKHWDKLSRLTTDDMNSFMNDLLNDELDVFDIPLPTGDGDYRDAPVSLVIALSYLLSEFMRAQGSLTGNNCFASGIRKRRAAGEAIGRWAPVSEDENLQ
jgi:hypothetical protein